MATYTDWANKYIPELSAGTLPVNTDYTNWMTEGLQVVINALPTDMLWMFETSENDTAENGVDVGTNKVLYVVRESDIDLIDSNGDGALDAKMLVECREVPSALRGRLTPGSGWMEEVSETDPVWYKLNNLLHILPTSTSVNTKIHWVLNPPPNWTASSTYLGGVIPLEIDPLIMAYIIYKSLCAISTDIIVEQRDGIKNLHGTITAIDTAVAAGKAALDRIKTFLWDNNSSGYLFTNVAEALRRARELIAESGDYAAEGEVDDGAGDFSALNWLVEEDLDLFTSVISLIQTELSRAQGESAHLDLISKTALSEAQGFFGEVQTRLSLITSELGEYQMNSAQRQTIFQEIMMESQKFLKEFQTDLSILSKVTYAPATTEDVKRVPTYSGISE